ncbi:hypothetical protein E2C01_040930 [Portunus trituberculatus]|uniref:Uncharacterized protein n=1 Tax=Portunus trituberculatus TaxID=210409 RepID=A0A5B7FL20_PORTR|nr:hypothetical protein [Portunus trituberculatus]
MSLLHHQGGTLALEGAFTDPPPNHPTNTAAATATRGRGSALHWAFTAVPLIRATVVTTATEGLRLSSPPNTCYHRRCQMKSPSHRRPPIATAAAIQPQGPKPLGEGALHPGSHANPHLGHQGAPYHRRQGTMDPRGQAFLYPRPPPPDAKPPTCP